MVRNISSADVKHSLASINKNATPRKGEHNIKHHFVIIIKYFVNSVKSKINIAGKCPGPKPIGTEVTITKFLNYRMI